MKLNASILFYHIQQYFRVEYVHITQNNWVKTPMFYNAFFDINEHIVLVNALDLTVCLSRIRNSVVLCLDVPNHEVRGTEGSNDLIVLNDPMSSRMAFNILNHILDEYHEFEHRLNEILYTTHSFQDMIEAITSRIDLPLSLTDANFRYIAYSNSSGSYINTYVTTSNGLPEETVVQLQQDEGFCQLEGIREAFVYVSAERCVCKNIYHDHRYVGRLAVIIPDGENDIDYIKAIFDLTAPYLENLYERYNSFSTVSVEFRKVHNYLYQIFHRQPADRREFLSLMQQLNMADTDELAIVNLLPRSQSAGLYSSAFTCEHLERHFPGCFCISMEESIIILVSHTFYQNAKQQDFYLALEREIENLHYIAGVSRSFHSLTVFEVLFSARDQALFALENRDRERRIMYYFDDYALSYLLQHGLAGTNFLQNAHPALITLKQHDEEHGTAYLKTLHIYMEENMNAVAAAKRLYIHRSSFISRMERMHRLAELDLSDPKERLYINLSFAMFLS